MKRLLLKIFGSIGIMILLSGCWGPEKVPKPDDLMDQNNYVDLLVELQYLRTYNNAYNDSLDADSIKSFIFERFGIKEEQFLSTHQYYQQQTDLQIIRVNEAIDRMRQEKDYIQAHIDSVREAKKPQSEDSVSINKPALKLKQ